MYCKQSNYGLCILCWSAKTTYVLMFFKASLCIISNASFELFLLVFACFVCYCKTRAMSHWTQLNLEMNTLGESHENMPRSLFVAESKEILWIIIFCIKRPCFYWASEGFFYIYMTIKYIFSTHSMTVMLIFYMQVVFCNSIILIRM